MNEVERLRAENGVLRECVDQLERQIAFLGQNRTLAKGLSGERLISSLIGGKLTVHTDSADIDLPDGKRVEVKYSGFAPSSKGYAGGRRWQWQKILGELNRKSYDYLLLVGDADSAFASSYKEPSSPYVLFCVARHDVEALTIAGTPPGARAIQLLTNPLKARGRSAELYAAYEITTAELTNRLGSIE